MPLSRQSRFNWWIVVVIAALAAPLWILIGGATGEMRIASAAQSSLALTVMYWLLLTTPLNAIRVNAPLSAGVIGLGAVWLQFSGGAEHSLLAADWLLWLVVFGLIAAVVARSPPPGAPSRESIWDFAPLLWHPMFWLVSVEPPVNWLILVCYFALAASLAGLMTRIGALALILFVAGSSCAVVSLARA